MIDFACSMLMPRQAEMQEPSGAKNRRRRLPGDGNQGRPAVGTTTARSNVGTTRLRHRTSASRAVCDIDRTLRTTGTGRTNAGPCRA
jgi:hypothetical protein